MAGNLGYELDLTLLLEEEKEMVKQQIQFYKENWELIHRGKQYRVDSPKKQGEYGVWDFVSEDQSEALLSVVAVTAHANRPVYYAKCFGLKPDARYQCKETGNIYSGSALAYVGLPVRIVNEEYFAVQYHLKEIESL